MSSGDWQRLFVLIVAGTALCWLTMQTVHEFGHVLAAWLTGGTVTQVVLHPLSISRTDIQPNPSPTLVAWGGPVVGILLPALTWLVVHWLRFRTEPLWRFWCGFCLIANGAYIGSGVVAPVGDAATMLQGGTPVWLLGVFGLIAMVAGLWCWHGQGRHFGVGPDATTPPRWQVLWVVGLLGLVITIELIAS